MADILMRLHEQQLQDEEELRGGGAADSGSDDDEDDPELVEGLRLSRALLLAEGKLQVEDLSVEEAAAFQRSLASGELAEAVAPWPPWWATEEAAQLELGPTGTSLVQVVEEEEKVEGEQGGEEVPSGLPPPPPAPLPPLASLSSKPPSPAVALHFLDVLYSYCLVMRLYNGQYSADPVGAAEALLACSAVLGGSVGEAGGGSPAAVLAALVAHACSPGAGPAQVPRGFAVGVLQDVAVILQLGRSVGVTAAMDCSRLVKAGQREARGAAKSSRTAPAPAPAKDATSPLVADLKKAAQKLIFFLSWANEAPPGLYVALSAQAEAAYQEQKATLRAAAAPEIVIK